MRMVASIVVALACLVAARQGVRTTGDLTWPPGPDFSRDIAAAEAMAGGHPLSDPLYRTEWIWYNPLVPAIVATLARVTNQAISLVYVRAGAYLNLLAPLAMFLLTASVVDAATAAAVVIAFLFVIPGSEPAWTCATYSPWLLPVQFAQGLFYLGFLALTYAWHKDKPWAFALAGGATGLVFLAHTAPALILGGVAVGEALTGVAGDRPARGRRARLLVVYILASALVASPFLASIVGHYRLQVRNPAPSAWVYTPLELARAWSFWREFLTPSLVGIISAVGWVMLFAIRARREARLLLIGAVVTVVGLGYSYLAQLSAGAGHSLPALVPGFHFLFYLRAFEAIGFGVGVMTIVQAGWSALRRSVVLANRLDHVPAIVGLAIIIILAASRYPTYVARPDFVGERGSAERMFADPALREMFDWLRRTTSPSDVVLAGDSLGLSVIGTAGRKVVAVDRLFSNPYVDWGERVRDRDEMLRLWAGADDRRFSTLAAKYRVRYVATTRHVAVAGGVSGGLALVWRAGDWVIYRVGS